MIIIVLVNLVIVGATVFVFYQSRRDPLAGSPPGTYDTQAIMTITAQGGLCNDGVCKHSVYNLYNNGQFEGHKNLSKAEISQLKDTINNTDIAEYGTDHNAFCQSAADGNDQILLFPQKYGNEKFIPCLLDIPKGDRLFSSIDELLNTHSLQRN